jgi:hypothetical protein
MDLSTLATILILAILTVIIFAFAFVVFRELKKTEKAMVEEGKRDGDILKDRDQRSSKTYKVANITTSIFSGLIATVAIGFMAFSLYIHNSGELFYINNKSLMVVASNSMKTVYTETQLETNGGYLPDNYADLEFSRGDILTLETVPAQEEMEKFQTNADGTLYRNDYGSYVNDYLYNAVFVYNNTDTKGTNIIHRLYYIGSATDTDTKESYYYYVFRGDNNNTNDNIRVKYSELKGMYVGDGKSEKTGFFILFFESVFGMYAVFSSVIMLTLSEVYTNLIQKEYDKRWTELDHHRLVLYNDIHDIHVKVQAGWANERYELRQKIGELKERSAENHEEIKNKVEEHHEEIKAKVEQHHEEVKAHIEEKKTPVVPAAPVTPEPAPVKPVVEKPAPAVEPKSAPKVEEPKPQPKPVEAPKPQPKPEEPKPMPKKVFGKHGVYVKIVKSDDDPLDESKPSGVAIKK